jgi:hypothetical protein
MRYRRALIPGASYFFTVNLADRSARLLVDGIADLRAVVCDVRRAHPFAIVACGGNRGGKAFIFRTSFRRELIGCLGFVRG